MTSRTPSLFQCHQSKIFAPRNYWAGLYANSNVSRINGVENDDPECGSYGASNDPEIASSSCLSRHPSCGRRYAFRGALDDASSVGWGQEWERLLTQGWNNNLGGDESRSSG